MAPNWYKCTIRAMTELTGSEAGGAQPEAGGAQPRAGAAQPGGLVRRYRRFLALPGTARLLLSSLAGRLPLGMTSLAVLLLVHQHTRSFTTAGVAVGAFTLMSASTTPLQGRLVDRLGGAPVLVGFAIAQAVGLAGLVVAAQLGSAAPALVVFSAIAAAMLEAAYALDATSQEVIWMAGPLLVAVAIALGSPAAAVSLSAVIIVCGTLWFSTAPATSAWRGAGAAARRPSAIRNPGLRLVVGAALLMGLGIG